MADAGGFKLHLIKKGNRAGLTVIMENGLCGRAGRWNGLDDSIARNHTVVTYSRAFIEKSGKGNPDRRGEKVAEELKTALNNTGIPGPYILVGYSLGGSYAKAFARTYPNDVKGVLLIDPLNTAQFYREYKRDFVYSFEFDSVDLGNVKEDHPCFNEIRFAINESAHGSDAIPVHIPTYMLVSSRAQVIDSLPPSTEGRMPIDRDRLVKEGNEIQKLWVKHQLNWASSYPNVKIEVTDQCAHGMHHERFDIVWEAYLKMMSEAIK